MASWQEGRGQIAFPPKLRAVGKLSENLLVGKSAVRDAKFEAETPILGKLKGKIEILSTDNLLCWKCAAVCRNSVGKS